MLIGNTKIDSYHVLKEEKEILRNLLEKYGYELSQYFNNDVNDLGLYGFGLDEVKSIIFEKYL